MESASYDPDKLPPPKDIWFEDEEIQKWFDDREELREARRKGVLDG